MPQDAEARSFRPHRWAGLDIELVGAQFARRMSSHVAPPTIGIIGGSISAGVGVGARSRNYALKHLLYSGLLSKALKVEVLNRAVPSTGVLMASFCLDQLLPEHVDVLVIEYAVNDALSSGGGAISTIGGARLSPQAAMERLLRSVLRFRPRTMPLILYVCKPGLSHQLNSTACEGLYTAVAEHYGVPEVSLARSLGRKNATALPWWTVHPQHPGHVAIADVLVRELPRWWGSSYANVSDGVAHWLAARAPSFWGRRRGRE